MSSNTGLCFIAELPFFYRILYKLSLYDIYNLMAVSSSLRYGVSQTNLHRILAEKSDEPHTGFIKPFRIIRDMEVRRWNPNPYIKLMINAGYIRDVYLVEYGIERYQIVKHIEHVDYFVHNLRTSVAASILIGGLDDSTLEWMDKNGFTDSYRCIKNGLDYLVKERSHLIMKYSSSHTYRFVDLVVNRYLRYDQDQRESEKQRVSDILRMLFAFCLGNCDLYVAEYIRTKSEIIDSTEESARESGRRFPDVLFGYTIKLFFKMLNILLLNPNEESIIRVLEYLEKTFDLNDQERCEICFVAFDIEKFEVIEWIDQNWCLGKLLLTRCKEINTISRDPMNFYLCMQIFMKIFNQTKDKNRAFKIVCDSITSQAISNQSAVRALRSTNKHTRKINTIGCRYLDRIIKTIDEKLNRIEKNNERIDLEESAPDNEVDFCY